MKRLLTVVATAALAVLLAVLAAYGLWLNRVRLAEEAFRDGRYQEAETLFEAVRSAGELKVLPDQLVEEDQTRVVLNLVQTGYLLGKYSETMELLKSENSLPRLGEKAEFHFWVGNLLLRQAIEGSGTNLMETLAECQGAYLESVRRAPDFWDAKYNYEYVTALLAQLRQGERSREPDIKLLLEHMRTDQQRRRKELPLQKRG